MRPDKCAACIASVRKYLPTAPIIVVDDSEGYTAFDCDYLIRLPFDSGLSRGRNAGMALARSSSDTVLLLDDDTELEADNGIQDALPLLDYYHIVTGSFVEAGGVRHYEHTFRFDGDDLYLDPASGPGVHIGHNFLLARSDIFVTLRWDDDYKIEAEHIDFFLQAYYLGLGVVYAPTMRVKHTPVYTGDYRPYRLRDEFYPRLVEKWHLSRIFDTEKRVWSRDTPPRDDV